MGSGCAEESLSSLARPTVGDAFYPVDFAIEESALEESAREESAIVQPVLARSSLGAVS